MFDTSNQMVVAVATYVQITTKNMASTTNEVPKTLQSHQSNCGDANAYVQFPLFFGLVDTNCVVRPSISTSTQNREINVIDMAHILAYKV